MYIFAGSLQAQPGKTRAVGEHLLKLKATAEEVAGIPAYAWRSVGGGPAGAFGLSTRVDSTAQLLAVQKSLGESDDFQRLSEEIAPLVMGPSEMTVGQIIAATQVGEPKAFATITNATMGGHVTRALTWAQDMLNVVTKVTGLNGVLTQPTSGRVFELSWIMGADSPEELDEASGKVATNEEYLHRLDEADGLFVEGSITRMLLAQL